MKHKNVILAIPLPHMGQNMPKIREMHARGAWFALFTKLDRVPMPQATRSTDGTRHFTTPELLFSPTAPRASTMGAEALKSPAVRRRPKSMTLASGCKPGWNPHQSCKFSRYQQRLLSENDVCSHHHNEQFTPLRHW